MYDEGIAVGTSEGGRVEKGVKTVFSRRGAALEARLEGELGADIGVWGVWGGGQGSEDKERGTVRARRGCGGGDERGELERSHFHLYI